MNKEFNLVEAIRIFLKWKKHIVIVCVLALVTSAIVTKFFMPDYYLSASTFYTANQGISDRTIMFNTEKAADVNYYGDKEDINRALTISNSGPVIGYAIEKFNLVTRYEIDTNKKGWRSKLRKNFLENYRAVKTENNAIEVSVLDVDPKMAADMANDIVAKIDEINRKHVNENKERQLTLFSEQIVQQQQQLQYYGDTLATLGQRYNIKVTSSGSESKNLVQGADLKIVEIYKALLSEQENLMKEMNKRISIKDQLEIATKNNASSLVILEKAMPADKKEKPMRMLICATVLFITFFLSLLGVLLIEQVADIRRQL